MTALMFFPVCCEASTVNSGIWAIMLLPLGFGLFSLVYATTQGYWFERRCERVWKATCCGLEGFKGTARSYRLGLVGAFILGDTKTIYPKLRDVQRSTHEGWIGMITVFGGQDSSDYNKYAEKFAFAFMVPTVSFEAAEDGRIRIRAGTPVPAAYNYPERPQMQHVATNQPLPKQRLSLDDIPPGVLKAAEQFPQMRGYGQLTNVWEKELQLLKAVPIARDNFGREFTLPIEGQHWFIAARTGGGKSSWIWSLVLGLEPAWRVGLVKFWGCDPKRLELAICNDCWEHYADTDAGMVELLEQAVSEMFERGSQLKGIARKFTPNLQTPLNVVVIDELGYLSSLLTDRKLQMRADYAIKTLLMQGRSNGFSVCGAVQDPKKSSVEYRDLFPIRIAGGLNEAAMVDLVLGKGMWDLGAKCEQVPIGDAGAGVAYVISETTLKPVCVRSAWCSDLMIQSMLAEPVQNAVDASQGKYENLGGQLDWNGQPL